MHVSVDACVTHPLISVSSCSSRDCVSVVVVLDVGLDLVIHQTTLSMSMIRMKTSVRK